MKKQDDASQRSFLSNCISAISSGARSAVSAASSAINDTDQQILWAGFDTLEKEDGDTRRVLLLALLSGFQVWDVEDTHNIHVIASSHDGKAFFLQMLPNPIASTDSVDRFSQSRPLLAVCGESSREESSSTSDIVPTDVYIYSLMSQSYVHTLKFQSAVYTVRCGSRIVAVLQEAQVHCFHATTLEMRGVIVTNPLVIGSLGVGYGPLAVGPRWIAYSGSRIANTSLILEHFLPPSSSSPSVAQFAIESGIQIASGIVSLGDRGYKSLTRYCSEVLPNSYSPGLKSIGNVQDADSVGMVIVKDIVSGNVIAQFKAHKSPISALCFDPSGRLLVTASTVGHNINVFLITPRSSNTNKDSYVHLFRLLRGFTDAVIQDISFCNDSNLIVVSTARGTSHLFEINPEGGDVEYPLVLTAINRIRRGNKDGWMSGAASVAVGMIGGAPFGAITSTFCYCNDEKKDTVYYSSASDSNSKKNLLVFAPSGYMTRFSIKANPVGAGRKAAVMTGFDHESDLETEGEVEVKPIQRWSMIQSQSRREVHGGGTAVEPWRVSKKGKARVENKHQYVSEAELQTHEPTQPPLWARENCSYQHFVLDVEEERRGGGTGEMKIEEVQTRTIETRLKTLVPVWGYLHSPKLQQVMAESSQSSGTITEGGTDQVAPLEGHGTESELGDEQSKAESSRYEEGNQSKTVDKGKGIAEENDPSKDEDEEETEQSKYETSRSEEENQSKPVDVGKGDEENDKDEEDGHGTETEQSKEESSRSEEENQKKPVDKGKGTTVEDEEEIHGTETEQTKEESSISKEKDQSKTVDEGKGIAEEKNDSEDEDAEEGHGTKTEQREEESSKSEEENQNKPADEGKGIAEEKDDSKDEDEEEGHGTEIEQSKEESSRSEEDDQSKPVDEGKGIADENDPSKDEDEEEDHGTETEKSKEESSKSEEENQNKPADEGKGIAEEETDKDEQEGHGTETEQNKEESSNKPADEGKGNAEEKNDSEDDEKEGHGAETEQGKEENDPSKEEDDEEKSH